MIFLIPSKYSVKNPQKCGASGSVEKLPKLGVFFFRSTIRSTLKIKGELYRLAKMVPGTDANNVMSATFASLLSCTYPENHNSKPIGALLLVPTVGNDGT